MLETLNNDIKNAMKNKEKEKLQALRYVKSMIMENNTSKKPASELDVIIKHYKKLKDGLVNFPAGHPMIEQTNQELAFLEVYLPKQLSQDEVQAMIDSIKEKLEKVDMGSIMKQLQPQIKGKFDGKKASEMVKNSVS